MQRMTAVVIPAPGDQNLVTTEVAVPDLAPEEILVEIKAIGVGIHDSYFLPEEMTYPYPIGIEAAGVVAKVGDAVTDHSVGDRIAFVSAMQPKGGVWAQYAAVRAGGLIVPIPEQMTFEQAATIPVAGNTTLRALHSLPPIAEGGSIFIAGASGAIGTLAIQLARARGWQVAASASAKNHDYLRELGVTLAVDYHDEDWPEQVRKWQPNGVDGALAVQPKTTAGSVLVVKDGGTVVPISGDQDTSPRVHVTGLAYGVDVHDELVELMADVVSGDLQIVIEKVYPFTEALDALAKTQTRHARGKLVISLS